MTVIAMTREMGSLGKDVAAGVANELGMEIIHHQVVEQDIGDKMDIPSSDVHRYLEGKQALLERWINRKQLLRYTKEEIFDLAAEDNIIIRGWGAATALKNIPHVLRVRVCAPLGFRVGIMQERLQTKDANLVRKEISTNDAAHTKVLRKISDSDWTNPVNYDLTLNTERLPISHCVQQIVALARSDAFQTTEQSKHRLNDLALESRVQNYITEHSAITAGIANCGITVDRGEVIVYGTVETKAKGNATCEKLKQLAGVRCVSNHLTVLPAQTGFYS